MIKRLLLGFLFALSVAGMAYAEEGLLQWDNGTPSSLEFLTTESHLVLLDKPVGWDNIYCVELSLYGQRYGDVGTTNATVVLWGPQSEDTAKLEDNEKGYVIYARKQFALKDVPETEGWFNLPLDVVELPSEFAVSVFTHSSEQAGLKIGLSAGSGEASHSTAITPDKMKDGREGLKLREDAKEWMIRLKVRSTLEPTQQITSEQLTGKNFSYFDDGQCDGFVTFSKYGPLVRVHNSGKRVVKRVYVYAKAEGDWFRTERQAAVYLLDSGLKILNRTALPYKNYTNQAAWHYAGFDDAPVPADFYVLVEPVSRAAGKLYLGYDTSSGNKASGFGTAGAFKDWSSEAPEESTNWMIRVEYE